MKKSILFSSFILIIGLVTLQNSYAQDDIIFRKHLVTNGLTGFYYGIAADVVFELDGAASVGIPVIISGASVVAPLIFNSNKTIDYDAMVLQAHGKTIGWAHGFALATLIGGENAWYGSGYSSNNYKLTVGLGALSSIGMGIVGNSLAKNNDWSEGQVELYRHYGWLMPYTGFSLAASFSDEPRVFGGAVLLFGAGGYLLADKIYQGSDYTRGEVRSMQVLSGLNMGLGWGIFADIQERRDIFEDDFKRAEFMIPAIGALAGTFAGQYYVRNTNFTPQQGMLTAYSATGGAVIGLGIALLTESENITPYYVLPYITGLGSYILSVEMLRKKNSAQASFPVDNGNNFHVSFMPQNLFLNNKIQDKGFMINGEYIGMQPLFAASLKF